MSKFNNLLQPLSCEWVNALTGVMCEENFTDMDSFIDHVRQCHLSFSPDSTHDHTHQGACQWCDCQFKTTSALSKEFKVHILFHTHHSYLKLLGREYQARLVLPDCHVDPDLANVLPLIEIDLKCQWGRGSCGAEFDCVSDLYAHVHRHVHAASTGDLTCKWMDCNHTCRDRSKLSDHTRVHTAERVVACPTCGSLFSNNTKLKDHLNRQVVPSTDLTHTCSFCHKCFSNERLLREHTRGHVNTVKCPHCDLTCRAPSRLMEHIRYRHVGSRPHECPLCHKTFKTTHTLVDHLETHREKCYSCSEPDCFYMTRTARTFNHHMRSVHGGSERLYCCHVCNSRFSLGKKLTQHLKDEHGFELPPGHCRFRYIAGLDGLKRLQTVRLDDETLITPELNVYQPSAEAPPTAPPPAETSQQPSTSTSTASSLPAVNDITMMSSLLEQQFAVQNQT